jgi:hypothetical protein
MANLASVWGTPAIYNLPSYSTILNRPANNSPKDESSYDHDPIFTDNSPESKDQLTDTDESAKYNRANPNSKHSV